MLEISLILERDSDGDWQATAKTPGLFISTIASTIVEIERNARDLIADHLENEGQDDPRWAGISVETVQFEHLFDVQEIFDAHPELNVNALARRMNMNPSLLRQYASGSKHPSEAMAAKIQTAIREIGSELSRTAIYA